MAILNNKQYNYPSTAYAGETIATAGCGPAAVSDLLGKDIPTIATWMTNNGYASNGYGTYHNGIYKCIQAYGYTATKITSSSLAGVTSSTYFDTFKTSIQNGYCGILLMGGTSTGCKNSYWCTSGHFIAVVGYSGGQYRVYDPASTSRDGYHDWSDFSGNIKHIYTTGIKWSSSSSTSTTTTTTTSSSSYSYPLYNSSRTKYAQKHLNNYVNAGLEIDGYIGQYTHKAMIKAVQYALNKDYSAGLAVDGSFGTKTSSALSGKNVTTGKKSELVRVVQILLTANGIDCGDVDASFGSKTLAAVKKYQTNNSLTVDGIAGPATIKKLLFVS